MNAWLDVPSILSELVLPFAPLVVSTTGAGTELGWMPQPSMPLSKSSQNTEPSAVVRERVARAAEELAAVREYDYAIVNDDLTVAVGQVAAILEAESRRVSRQDDLTRFVERLRAEVSEALEKI